MKQSFYAFTVVAVLSLTFSSCGEKCYKCKTWNIQGNGTWLYSGEQELCDVKTKYMNEKLDFAKNDSTDGWECEKVFK